jgi:hypothetical protein
VTIAEVQVKKQGANEGEAGWETFAALKKTYNLLKLMNGAMVPLGVGELEAGQYGQIRLILGESPETENNILGNQHPSANYFINSDDEEIELKVPSGYQSGVKIVKGFTIVASGDTELLLDFDAHKSIVKAGSSDQWLLKPTIKVLEIVENLTNSISGTVTDADTNTIEGAVVNAQIFNPLPDVPGSDDVRDEVIVESTTVTMVMEGKDYNYKFLLTPDIYNIVVVADGYLLACQEVEAFYYEDYTADFELVVEDQPTELVEISGTISGLADEESVRLSVRQTADCGSGDVTIEVDSDERGNGVYSFTLPAGTYKLVASSEDETKEPVEFSQETVGADFDFSPPSS